MLERGHTVNRLCIYTLGKLCIQRPRCTVLHMHTRICTGPAVQVLASRFLRKIKESGESRLRLCLEYLSIAYRPFNLIFLRSLYTVPPGTVSTLNGDLVTLNHTFPHKITRSDRVALAYTALQCRQEESSCTLLHYIALDSTIVHYSSLYKYSIC